MGTFYNMRVTAPDGTNYSTSYNDGWVQINNNNPTQSLNDLNGKYENENCIDFTDGETGAYQIYGAYIYNASMGSAPYQMMVLGDPKRLGQATEIDEGSAAKVAGTDFVSQMTKNQVGVVWFNDSSYIAPVASFSAVPLTGNEPLTVQFYDNSSDSPSQWSWAFGDGGTSPVENPVYTYSTPGVYNVSLTATNTGGSSTLTKVNYIIVHNAKPAASFTATPSSGNVPLTVGFTDTSSGANISSWEWNYGDGSANGTTPTPSHQFTHVGTYTVTLTVGNDGGYSTCTGTISVLDANPVASFTTNTTNGDLPLTVQFTNTSTGANITGCQWTFGDGNVSTSSNPVHTFYKYGSYSVTLTVTNDGGSSLPYSKTITVLDQAPVAKFNVNTSSGNVPMTVAFTNVSTGANITGWTWNFGDGTNSTATNPTHKYTVAGTYTANLTVTNDGGSSTSASKTITVNTVPIAANFTGSPTSGDASLAVTFTDLSVGSGIDLWQWNFGDGSANVSTTSSTNPSHTFSSYGNYTVTLTVTNTAGSSSTLQRVNYITVWDAKPVANFTGNVTSGAVPLTVLFTDHSTGANITLWQWSFGDGSSNVTSATSTNPIHTYNATGKYTVMLTVTNDGGSSTLTRTTYITVSAVATPTPTATATPTPTPVANFTASPTSGNAPLTVTFTNKSTGPGITSLLWTFGDGNTSTAQNPTDIYSTPGVYNVSLKATNGGGSNTKTITSCITVHNATPVASFTSNVTSGDEPLNVKFYDTSTGSDITGWQWSFGDNSSNATTQDPVHTYNSSGSYTVTLTVTNDGGSSTKKIVNYITVIHNTPPVASFTYTPTNGYAPLTVQFTDTSTGNNINQWSWSFGDSSPVNNLQNPSHTYANPGTYTVTMAAANDGGSSNAPQQQVVVVSIPPPTAAFTANTTSGHDPLSVQFTNQSTGMAITGILWNFGDGGSSISSNPVHTYTSDGTFTVTLTVTNAGGSNMSTETNYITVVPNAPPAASFTGSPTSGSYPLTVSFHDTSSGSNIYSWLWNFGDGNTSTQQNPAHVYSGVGVYTVSLTVTNDGGNSTATYDNYIMVSSPAPTVIPMLTGLLAKFMGGFSPVTGANAGSSTPMTPPAGTAIGLTTVDSTTMQEINNSIFDLAANGGTNIGAGIAQAIQEFNSADYISGNRKFIVLLTDGYSQYPNNDIAQAQNAANDNITIFTIGLGMPDSATLSTISNMTGGQYTKVTSLQQLINTYSAIANNMTDIAANNVSFHSFTGYSSTLGPDTEYVFGNSSILLPDGVYLTGTSADPSLVNNTTQSLDWEGLGSISYNQNMTLTYQLQILRSGNITPVDNDSYVNSSAGPSFTTGGSVGASGTPQLPSNVSQDLAVHITFPYNGYTLTSNRLPIQWSTNYTGNESFDQMVSYDAIPLLPVSPNSYTRYGIGIYNETYTWDTSNLVNGNYTIWVNASDSYGTAYDRVNITVLNPTGQINLE
jgi:PKD repeat protein